MFPAAAILIAAPSGVVYALRNRLGQLIRDVSRCRIVQTDVSVKKVPANETGMHQKKRKHARIRRRPRLIRGGIDKKTVQYPFFANMPEKSSVPWAKMGIF